MCGIVGWVDFTGQNATELRIRKMGEAIRHRGPDDEGYQLIDNVGLGHRRLSVIDLSANGRQPMSNATGNIWLTYNGEIYNYKDLRKRLEDKGYSFQSASDTEVILYAYEDDPNTFLEVLDGMFAFALYDARRNRLIVARDRLGKKPLYYTQKLGQFFAFASEIKGLLTQPEVSRTLNDQGIRSYLEFGFVPAPESPFKEIYALPAGCLGILDTKQGEWIRTPAPYWDIQFHPAEIGEAEALKQFETLIHESVRKRLQADVPVGVLLSGGLDSTTITAVTRACIGPAEALHSFSVGFDIPAMDESAKAKSASEVFNTVHHEFMCTDEDFIDVLPTVLKQVDSLFSEQFVPMYLVSRMAKQEVTVVLSGDGADEVLGGYNSYANVARYEKLLGIPLFQDILKYGLQGTLPALNRWAPNLKRQLSRVHHMSSVSQKLAYLAYRYSNTLGQDCHKLFLKGAPLSEALGERSHPFVQLEESLHVPEGLHRFDRYLYLDLKANLTQYILMKSDLMSMAHGLELRCPFLDAEVMSFLFSLPLELKHHQGQSKWLLRQYLKPKVPFEIYQQKKAGFSAPFGYWLRERPRFYQHIQTVMGALLQEAEALEINEAYVHFLFREHQAGISDHSQRLWSLMILLAWFGNYSGQTSSREVLSDCVV
jgi:asparagine synthase (glutamine-hydrolysing)